MIFYKDEIVAWEKLPNDVNRRVSVRHYKFELELEPNKESMKFHILKKIPTCHISQENSEEFDDGKENQPVQDLKRFIPKQKDFLDMARNDDSDVLSLLINRVKVSNGDGEAVAFH